jgi:hypothetical protein
LKVLRSKCGLSILEVMIAVTIGTLIFGSIAAAMRSGNLLAMENRARLYAMNGLREELEFLRGMGNSEFDAIDAMDGSTFSNAQIVKLNGGIGSRDIDASFGADIREVTLAVSWTARSGQAAAETLTTRITRRGINGR